MRQGHDAVHVRALGLAAATDATIYARAAAEQRVVVTADRDFSRLAVTPSGVAASVVLLRLRDFVPAAVIDRLGAWLAQGAQIEPTGVIVSIDDQQIRVRRLGG